MLVNILFGGFVLFEEIENHLKVISIFTELGKGIGPEFFLLDSAKDLFCFLGIVPEIVCVGLLFELSDLRFFFVNVKDASLALLYAPGGHGSVLRLS